jgi:CHAT domain-containing protein
MTDTWRSVGAATNDMELRAVLAGTVGDETLARDLLGLADRLEEAVAPAVLLQILELAVRSADAAGAPAALAEASRRRDALLAGLALHLDATAETLADLDQVASLLAASGDLMRAIDIRLGASLTLLAQGMHAESVTQAHHALDLLTANPDLLAQTRHAHGGTLRPGPNAVFALIQLCDELSSAAAHADGTIVIARFGQAARGAGLEELHPLAALYLGSLLVRLGDAESGIELLRDVVNAVPNTDLGRPALDRGRLWYAIGLHHTGRSDQALTAFRAHDWWLSDDQTHRVEIMAHTVRLLVDEGRLTEALDLLEAAEPADNNLVRALRAKVEALLQRPSTIQPDPQVDSDELAVWARHAWLERDVLTDPLTAYLPDEVTAVKQAFTRLGIRQDLSRIRADLALARGDAESALHHAHAALDAVLTPVLVEGWQQPWHGQPTENLTAALSVSTESAARRGRGLGADLWLRMARAEELLGRDPANSLNQAIAGAARRNQHATHFAALLAEARRKERGGAPVTEWRNDLERAADILEGLRARLRDEELQLRGVADQDLVYAQLLDSALEGADLDGILRVLERAKARTLLDRVLAALGGADELGLADRDEARALRERVVRGLSRRLTDPWAPDEVGPVAHRLATVFRRRRPPVVSTRAAATPDQVRQLATRGTLLLHYFCTPERITLTPVGAHTSAPTAALDITPEEVRTYLEVATVERQLRSTPHSLTELYDALIAPVGPLLEDVQRVLIVPHGVLHSVPFPALRQHDGRYLIERLPVVHAPSGAVASRASERLATPAIRNRSVAFGLELAGYLPLAALSCVPDELDAVERTLPGVERLDRVRARRQALLDLDGDLDVLHFACHGEFDPDDALMSRLYLADGPVYGYELLGLRARPRLVVFSACETGRYELLPGDEVMGLVRPFLGLGAGTVVATLWEVPDASTTDLMSAFYRGYASSGHDPAACLREAQLTLLRSERFAHPHYWAPYVAIGGVSYG